MRLSDFDYDLPPEFIAQTPAEPRDSARLLVMDRRTGALTHAVFSDLGQFLRAGDVLILNDTRVIPARLFARKSTGGRVEVLMLYRRAPLLWEVLVGGKGVHVGTVLEIEGRAGVQAVVMEALPGARRVVQFSQPVSPILPRVGHTPLPPYIHTPLTDAERYQTVYARYPGSAAAPTAGLHFTQELLDRLRFSGVKIGYITLHVGLDTFAPVTAERIDEHPMHGEMCQIAGDTVELVNAARREGRRVIAVGTTCVRTLEYAATRAPDGAGIERLAETADLFIRPGHAFRVVDGMITNFHLPKTTLLMLVSAFAGRERILAAYEEARRQGYRFYSFGDAMLIV